MRCIRNSTDLRAIFDQLREHSQKLGVTDYVRTSIAAEFVAPDIISTSYETRIMNGNLLLQPAYPVYSTLLRVDGEWKVNGGVYAMVEDTDLIRALHAEPPSD